MASKRVTDAFSKEMRKFGYSPIDVLDIGTDPFTHGEHYIVVGKSDAVGNYATWSGVDWAHHPNAADRKRGVTLNSGRYGFKTKTEAMEDARSRVYNSKRDTRWDAVSSDNRKAKKAGAGKTKEPTASRNVSSGSIRALANEIADLMYYSDDRKYGHFATWDDGIERIADLLKTPSGRDELASHMRRRIDQDSFSSDDADAAEDLIEEIRSLNQKKSGTGVRKSSKQSKPQASKKRFQTEEIGQPFRLQIKGGEEMIALALKTNGLYGLSRAAITPNKDHVASELLWAVENGYTKVRCVSHIEGVIQGILRSALEDTSVGNKGRYGPDGNPEMLLTMAEIAFDDAVNSGDVRDNAKILVDDNYDRFKAVAKPKASQNRSSGSKPRKSANRSGSKSKGARR